MRVQWSLEKFTIAQDKIRQAFMPLAREFSMDWRLMFTTTRPKVALFASRQNHCLYDLLLRHQDNQFNCDIALIVSNHKEIGAIASHFAIPFLFSPKTKNQRLPAERKELALLRSKKIDVVVLSRYMQILSKNFVEAFPNRIINIHHSFLPAFAGKEPYEQAYCRGVKIIGATSHYVTNRLDEGPIIEQNTVRVSHRDSLPDLKRKGKDLERMVLSQALRWHLEHKILVYNNKTVVFD
jgi:formyltetrahydrofolate deformylase